MIDMFRSFYRTVKTWLSGVTAGPADTPTVSAPASVQSSENTGIPIQEVDSPVPEILVGPAAENASVDAWSVHPYVDPVFVKVGRIYLNAGDLIIRSDRDTRGFLLPEDDIDKALTGGSGTVRLLDLTATVGTAHLSTSGLALNMVIDQQLHTVPLRSLIPVLNGNHRKAPLFVPADDVKPD